MRTTVDIDEPILRDLKKLQKKERKPLGRLISDLLAVAMRNSQSSRAGTSKWITKVMRARVDLEDRDAVFAAMENK